MSLDNMTGYPAKEAEFTQQLDYLYKRLDTVNNLIRSLQEYDLHRPKATRVLQRQSA